MAGPKSLRTRAKYSSMLTMQHSSSMASILRRTKPASGFFSPLLGPMCPGPRLWRSSRLSYSKLDSNLNMSTMTYISINLPKSASASRQWRSQKRLYVICSSSTPDDSSSNPQLRSWKTLPRNNHFDLAIADQCPTSAVAHSYPAILRATWQPCRI